MPVAYYNEVDPYAAAWLRNLIAARLIAPGDVDERSIVDVDPADLDGYAQCHFFAGIGGWPYALRLSGWPDDRPVWTGSCPCQPLSSAGQRKGHADERHLWPTFHALIAERQPTTVFGEQVAGALGREWLAGVRADLESAGYAIGAADLCAASVGAPHIRQRLFWVADANGMGRDARPGDERRCESGSAFAHNRSAEGGLGDADESGSQGRRERSDERTDQQSAWQTGQSCGLGAAASVGCCLGRESEYGVEQSSQGVQPDRSGARGFWDGSTWLPCLDGKARRVEPSIFPLAYAGEWGLGSRMGILRGAGNAIVPQAAAAFVSAFMDLADGG